MRRGCSPRIRRFILHYDRAIESRKEETMPEMFDFSEALRRLRHGKYVARLGWNGKRMYIFAAYGGDNGYPHSQPCGSAPYISMRTPEDLKIAPCICMRTAQSTIQPGWLASQTDMFADDWMEATPS
jgi:hypothetical protein